MKFEEWFEAKYGIAYNVPADIFNKDVVKGLKLGWEAKEKFLADNGLVEPKFKSYHEHMLDKLSGQLLEAVEEQTK